MISARCYYPQLCYAIIFLLICVSRTTPVSGEPLLNCSRVPEDQRTWSIKHNFCRLWSHTSRLLKDPITGKPIIAIAGGMAKYRFEWEGQDWEVPDLHGDLDILRIGNDFTLDELPLDEARRNPKINGSYVPVVNRGYMWVDSSGQIFLSGGQFWEDGYFDESQYYVPTSGIPEWSIWRYNIAEDKWAELFPSGDPAIRSISTGYTSIPGDKSYSAEGYWTQRSNPNAPPGVGMATNGVLVYDHSRNTIQNITDPAVESGFTHGALHYIGTPGGNKGVLLSLMAMEYPLGENFSDADPLQGKSNNFTNLRFFSIEDKQWYSQRASFIDDNRPSTRTRFCSVLMQEEGAGYWQLYMLGGQSIEDPFKGPADIWVLSIPVMIWIQITNPFDNVQLKGHTCHAVGGSIVVVGGYPPSPPGHHPDLGCDTRFVRVFDTNQQSWVGNFKANTKYKPPEKISYWAQDKPVSGWGSPELESIFSDLTSTTSTSTTLSPEPTDPPPVPPPPRTDPGMTVGEIIGLVVGVSAIILILLHFLWKHLCRMWRNLCHLCRTRRESEDPIYSGSAPPTLKLSLGSVSPQPTYSSSSVSSPDESGDEAKDIGNTTEEIGGAASGDIVPELGGASGSIAQELGGASGKIAQELRGASGNIAQELGGASGNIADDGGHSRPISIYYEVETVISAGKGKYIERSPSLSSGPSSSN